MLFSFNWISDYVDHGADVDEVARRLTAAGLSVEGVEEEGGDRLLEIDVTTNRPDCMNHLGIAREVAVLFGRPLEAPTLGAAEAVAEVAGATVELEDSAGCPRYVARVVDGVTVGPSPDWLVERLEAIGQRAINNVVDVTNYVLWETGQPIHAFDLDKLAERAIVVRRARDGESLVTLDGETRRLDGEVLVIADAERAVALAGIMGGLESEVTAETRTVLIESAHFAPAVVRRGARKLGMHTDACHRFERGADPGGSLAAASRVAELLAEVAGGTLLPGAVDRRGEGFDWRLEGRLDLARLNAFGGVQLAGDDVEGWLGGLGFGLTPEGEGAWRVEVPTWRYYDMRPDPSAAAGAPQAAVWEADLFEEALRLHGFDAVPATLPAIGGPDEGASSGHLRRQVARQALAGCGYAEAVTYAFHAEAELAAFPAIWDGGAPVRLANPLSELYDVMRRSLLPGLVAAARFNQRRGAEAVRLFEIGHVFPGGEAEEAETVALVAGGRLGTPWDRRLELDLFDLKGALGTLAESFGRRLEATPAEIPALETGTAAELRVGDPESGDPGPVVGYLGRLAADEDRFPLYVAELSTAPFVERPVVTVGIPSRHPAVEVDLTLTHAVETSWREIAAEIAAAGVADLSRYGLKDRYRGKGVPPGAVNTTVYFVYNADDRSLTQDEVNERHAALARRLEERFGWKGGS